MKLLRIIITCLVFSICQISLFSASLVEITIEKEIVKDNRQTVKNAKQTFEPEITLKSFDAFLKEKEDFPINPNLPIEQTPQVVIDDVIVFLDGDSSVEEIIVFNDHSGFANSTILPSVERG
ncbi:MAG: hypothetical protein AAF960_23965 [Bacteroidota bacterium]